MRHVNHRLLAAALIAAALFAASTDARKGDSSPLQAETKFFRLSDDWKPDGFEAQLRGGKVVGMSIVKKGGTRVALKKQANPPRATSCPGNQFLDCWEDEGQLVSICECKNYGLAISANFAID